MANQFFDYYGSPIEKGDVVVTPITFCVGYSVVVGRETVAFPSTPLWERPKENRLSIVPIGTVGTRGKNLRLEAKRKRTISQSYMVTKVSTEMEESLPDAIRQIIGKIRHDRL